MVGGGWLGRDGLYDDDVLCVFSISESASASANSILFT